MYDLGALLKGSYGARINQTSKIWDNVAAQVLVEEAGGVCTDLLGNPLDYSNPLTKANVNYTYLAAANKTLHNQLLEIIKKHYT